MLFYLSLYLVGIVVGLALSMALDLQLRRPGIRQALGLVILALLLWAASLLTQRSLADVLLPLVWAGTGLLAGLGSRRAPFTPA